MSLLFFNVSFKLLPLLYLIMHIFNSIMIVKSSFVPRNSPVAFFHNASHGKKIIGGIRAKITNHPYYVLVLSSWENPTVENWMEYPIGICGGVLIHIKVVITAAHCFYDHDNKPAKRVFTITGAQTSADVFKDVREARKIDVHEDFDDTVANDIALIEIKRALSSVATSAPPMFGYLMSPQTEMNTFKDVVIVGFGREYPTYMEVKRELVEGQYVEVPIPIHSETLRSAKIKLRLPGECTMVGFKERNNICFGGVNGWPGVGDSGGPIIATNKEGNKFLIGIIGTGIHEKGQEAGIRLGYFYWDYIYRVTNRWQRQLQNPIPLP